VSTDFSVPGFRAAGVCCGIKARDLDLALITSDVLAAVAGVFTRSTVVGAPVEVSREHARKGRARGVVVNSGISNVAMGQRGLRDAREMTKLAARALDCAPEQVLVASTGVIGEPLPMAKLRKGIPKAAAALDRAGLPRAAEAIRTTDTFAKIRSVTGRIGGKTVKLSGMAKGSGMIEPNMATMLSFLVTDAAVSPAFLRRLLKQSVDVSFNKVTVDGEGSTSDTVLLMANGLAGNAVLRSASSPGAGRFAAMLTELCEGLAQDLARDGEGATKLVTVEVSGARNPAQADLAARRIANSMLVKTATFGGDPNWGRILQTVGAGRVQVDLQRAEVQLGGVTVFRRGSSAGAAARRRAEARLKDHEVTISLSLGAGRSKTRIWTCDLTYDYVKINAEYTT